MSACMRAFFCVSFLWGRGVAGAQGVNNLAETSSIMKGSPEGCVSPPAVPVQASCERSPTDAVELAERGSVLGEGWWRARVDDRGGGLK